MTRRPLGDATARAGLGIVTLLALLAVAAPLIAPYDPLAIRGAQLESPSAVHPMGTDSLGRDIFSRVLHGARVSLGAALLALALIVLVGVTAGLVSGYYGGWTDAVLMRLADVVLAVPTFILVLAIVGLFGAGLAAVVLAICGVWWVRYGRVVRGLVLTCRERMFVESARALGAGDARILLRHVLPDVIGPALVLATLDVGSVVLAIAAFNFLGLGAAPPTPEWGAMISEGKDVLFVAPHVLLFPGAALTTAVLGFNLLGEGLADRLGRPGSGGPSR